MRTKSLLFTTFIIFFGFIQTKGQAIFGIKGGLNEASLVFKSDGVTTTFNSKTSFHIGGTVEFPISGHFYIEPGLLFSGKGGKDIEEGFKDEILSLTYVDLPVNLLYKHAINSSEFQVFGFAGPYAGLLVSAKDKVDKQSVDIKDNLKEFDAGINIGAGVQISNLILGLQYEFGLANLAKGDGVNTSNRVFSISIGYKFLR